MEVRVALTGLTLHDALTSQDHDSSKSNAEGRVLPKTEQRETSGGLESTFLILSQYLIIFLCLILLIIEILNHSRNIQQFFFQNVVKHTFTVS